jgi:hypothetical protein
VLRIMLWEDSVLCQLLLGDDEGAGGLCVMIFGVCFRAPSYRSGLGLLSRPFK